MKRLIIGFVVWAAIASPVYGQEGGLVRLKLSSGDYTVRPGNGDRISVHWEPNEPANKKKLEEMKKIKVHVETSGLITTIRTEGPTRHARMVIEIPARTDLYLRMRAGDVRIEGIEGNKDIHMTAGELNIDVRPSSYSYRNASIGLTRLARRAGIQTASRATAVKTIGTDTNTAGSQGWTLNRNLVMNCVRLNANETPSTTPTIARVMPCKMIMFLTRLVSAPSARRIPISGVRCSTE